MIVTLSPLGSPFGIGIECGKLVVPGLDVFDEDEDAAADEDGGNGGIVPPKLRSG